MKHKLSTAVALLAALIIFFLPATLATKGVLWVITGLIWLLLTAYGSYNIRLNWFLNSTCRMPGRTVALTFDDGPDPELTPAVLSILKETGAKATFFLIGEKAEKHPQLVKAILFDGHQIGNHSYCHSGKLGFLSVSRLEEDLTQCNTILEKIAGRSVTLFRPPFGVTNPNYARVLSRLNLSSVGWSLRSYDTVIRNEEKLVARLKEHLHDGAIILLHDTVAETVAALPDLIADCKKNQLEFVTVS